MTKLIYCKHKQHGMVASQSEETYTKLNCKNQQKNKYDAKVNSKLMVLLGKVL